MQKQFTSTLKYVRILSEGVRRINNGRSSYNQWQESDL